MSALTPEKASIPLDDKTEPKTYGDKPGKPGPLLGKIGTPEEQKAVARAAVKIWESKDRFMERFLCQWKLNVARRKGVTSGKLQYNSVDDHWTAWFPEDASPDNVPDDNQLATSARQFPSVMFADPPAPIVEPNSGGDDDEDAAEFSTRALIDLQSEGRLNTVRKCRTAFDMANDFGSGFILYHIDDHGGGKIPLEIQAHAEATHVDNALIDPKSGAEQGPYVSRFVKPDGSFTEDENEAALIWAKDLRGEVVTGRNVRPIPHTASDIEEAYGVQVAVFDTFGNLKKRFPDLQNLSNDEKQPLFAYLPEHADMLLPVSKRQLSETEDENEKLVFVLTTIYEECSDYEYGAYVITLGETFVAHQQEWCDESTGRKRALMLPIAQVGQFDEGRDTFYKVGLSEIIGGANEARAAQLAAQLDWLDKLNNQKIFLPVNSIITPQQLQYPRGTVLYHNPGGEPSYQNLPPYPKESVDLRAELKDGMKEAIGVANAFDLGAPQAESGRQLYGIVSQMHASLSEPKQHVERGYIRCCRIELQLARAFLKQSQRLKWKGDDGQHMEKRWSGADLSNTTDVLLKTGSLTMLSPAAKAQFTEHLLEMGMISPDEAKEMINTNLTGLVGLQEDPFRMRIRRQIAQWCEGPPEGWTDSRKPQPVMQADPMTGAPVQAMQPPPPIVQPDPMSGVNVIMDPVLQRIWAPVRCDTLPNIASIRVTHLAKLMSSTKYQRWPDDWKLGVEVEYDRMIAAQQPMAPQPQPGKPAGPPKPNAQPAGPEGAPPEQPVPPEMQAAA